MRLHRATPSAVGALARATLASRAAGWALSSVLMCLVLASGCSKKSTAITPFAFNRPEHLGYLCIDPTGSADPASTHPLVLPMRCCAPDAPLVPKPQRLSSPYTNEACPYDVETPSLHALVTQSTRGEVAAVDLVEGEVLDSDPLVPGYTFVDVGGLPAAIVTPVAKPLPKAKEKLKGPAWVYVASAEDLDVVAVASCRFRLGGACGPELSNAPESAGAADAGAGGLSQMDMEALAKREHVPLPAAPGDMVLGPDGALWVSLPDLGMLARIALSENDADPFAMSADGTAPLTPTFFPLAVPSDVDVDPGDLLEEDPVYDAVCGVGYTYEKQTMSLPTSTREPAAGTTQPSRMRLDEDNGLLLVADRVQPVLHAFAIEDDKAVPRGYVPTGAPIRDFALTAAVPAKVDPSFGKSSKPSQTPTNGPRYVYAIDDRDGSLMALTYDYDEAAQAVSSKVLAAPDADRYRDRIKLNGAVATALDIVDTRGLSPWVCGLSGTESPAALDKAISARTAAVNAAQAAADAAPNDAKKQEALRNAQLALGEAQSKQSIQETAGGSQLRGVFAVVAAQDGFVRVIDVHDLDLTCRSAQYCSGDKLLDVDNAEPVALHRHAARLFGNTALAVTVSDPTSIVDFTCPDGYGVRLADDTRMSAPKDQVCAPNDPWQSLDQAWNPVWEGSIPQLTLTSGFFVKGDTAGQLVLEAPSGYDFCSRGVVAKGTKLRADDPTADSKAKAAASAGDQVWVVGEPSQGAPATCTSPDPVNPPRLTIVKAEAGRLVLQPDEARYRTQAERDALVRTLLECYPDFAGIEVHVHNEFLVLGLPSLYLHRMTTGADGACIVDTTQDPRMISRVPSGGTYVNPYVAFKLAQLSPADAATISPSIAVSGALPRLSSGEFDPNIGRTDALPVVVSFLPYTQDLFVLDSASQGLSRFELSPFGRTSTSFR